MPPDDGSKLELQLALFITLLLLLVVVGVLFSGYYNCCDLNNLNK
jgi:hypothetical protein